MQSSINTAYNIELPNDKATTYNVVTFIIALINMAAFAYSCFTETDPARRLLYASGAAIAIIALVFFVLRNKIKTPAAFPTGIGFIVCGLVWIFSGDTWLGLPLLLFAGFGFYATKRTILQFSSKGILYPSFPPRLINWVGVDFVILKDGILTLELTDNRVFQFTLSKQEAGRLDEDRFNDFCNSFTSRTQSR